MSDKYLSNASESDEKDEDSDSHDENDTTDTKVIKTQTQGTVPTCINPTNPSNQDSISLLNNNQKSKQLFQDDEQKTINNAHTTQELQNKCDQFPKSG